MGLNPLGACFPLSWRGHSRRLKDRRVLYVIQPTVFIVLALLAVASHLYIVAVLWKKPGFEVRTVLDLECTLLPLDFTDAFEDFLPVETEAVSWLVLASKPWPPPFSFFTGGEAND